MKGKRVMAKRKKSTRKKTVFNPSPVTATRVKGGVSVRVKVRDMKTAKKIARKMGVR